MNVGRCTCWWRWLDWNQPRPHRVQHQLAWWWTGGERCRGRVATTPCHAPADHGDDDGDYGGGDEDNGDGGDGGGGDAGDGVGGGDDDNKDKDDAGIMHLPTHT